MAWMVWVWMTSRSIISETSQVLMKISNFRDSLCFRISILAHSLINRANLFRVYLEIPCWAMHKATIQIAWEEVIRAPKPVLHSVNQIHSFQTRLLPQEVFPMVRYTNFFADSIRKALAHLRSLASGTISFWLSVTRITATNRAK